MSDGGASAGAAGEAADGCGSGGGEGGMRRGDEDDVDWESMIQDVRARLHKKTKEREQAETVYNDKCTEEYALEQELESLKKGKKRAMSKKDYSGSFWWSEQVNQVLTQTFKLPSFRPKQREIINAAISGRDTLVMLPTGGGKSLVFQIPACVEAGFCLVVSPLISLMHDQVSQLRRLGVGAEMMWQDTDKDQAKRIHDMMLDEFSKLKLLYVTPERVAKSKTLMSKLEKAHERKLLSRVVIDEAHCISQWGHDWRPDYGKLKILKEQLPKVPMMALTATATRKVQEHIMRSLGLYDYDVFQASVDRPNLQYEVALKPDKVEDMKTEVVRVIKERFEGQPGIVYCCSQKETEAFAQALQEEGISAAFYHAGEEKDSRMDVHNRWMDRKTQVIVATIAFGMGINKEDVRFVIHQTMPKGNSAYYQEAGRAGRDGEPATCILYYKARDIVQLSEKAAANSQSEYVLDMYDVVKYCEEMLTMADAPKHDMHLLGRQLIAQHFHESPNLIQRAGQGERTDLTRDAKVVRGIIECVGKCKGQITTLLQLTNMWLGRGRKAEYAIVAEKAPYSFEECSRRIVMMLVEGTLKQTFKFTGYGANGYIIKGAKDPDSRPILACVKLLEEAPTAAGKPKKKAPAKAQGGGGRKRAKREKAGVEGAGGQEDDVIVLTDDDDDDGGAGGQADGDDDSDFEAPSKKKGGA